MGEAKIDVLLATRNGERFLKPQLESLFRQTVQNFRLLARDDCSTDSTLEIVETFRARYPKCVEVQRNAVRHGACQTFSLLAQQSTSPYFAFCDQDDIWRPDKLELSMRAMKDLEHQHGIVNVASRTCLAGAVDIWF